MRKWFLAIVLFVAIESIAFSQCIDREKIQKGYTFDNYKHSRSVKADTITYTQVYAFAQNDEVYQNGNYLVNDAIDIKQAANNIRKYRQKGENAIKAYAGNKFFSELHFKLAVIVYPERVEVPIGNGHSKIEIMYKKIKDQFKYVYLYDFKADSISSCEFRFQVDRFGKVILNFELPPKGRYKPINKHFTYCQLIHIARKAQTHIDPIRSIKLCYNINNKRFYWIISQDISDKALGSHYYNYVQIDAADLSKVKKAKGLYEMGITEQ